MCIFFNGLAFPGIMMKQKPLEFKIKKKCVFFSKVHFKELNEEPKASQSLLNIVCGLGV